MVLADPGLVVTEVVEHPHQLEIALDGEVGIEAGHVHRGEKDPESHRLIGHRTGGHGPET